MIGIATTADDDDRNEYGMPITANVPHNRGNFHQAVDQSVNKALPWVAFSWLLSGLSIGMTVFMLAAAPAYIDAKVAAGSAKAEATAQTAKEHGRIALAEVERANAELAEKGLIRKADH